MTTQLSDAKNTLRTLERQIEELTAQSAAPTSPPRKRFRVWEPGITPRPGDVFFRLFEGTFDGGVILKIVDSAGSMVNCPNVMGINGDGKIYRCGSVNAYSGLSRDSRGYVEITGGM